MKAVIGLAVVSASLLLGGSAVPAQVPVGRSASLVAPAVCGPGGRAADFNNDGYADLVIGARGEDAGAGEVNVLYGGAYGLPSSTVANQTWSQDSPNVEGIAEPGDGFGWATTSGDFNNDGYSDLAVGAPLEDFNATDAGRVSVIYGAKGGLSATVIPDQVFGQGVGGVDDIAEASDEFGHSLTTGDINGDGYDDLVIGVLGENSFGGAVEVIFGSSAGLSTTTVPDQFRSQDSPNMDGSQMPDDLFSFSLTTGDFNNDGYADLAAGVPKEDGVAVDEGAVHIVYGSSGGLSATTVPDLLLTQATTDVHGDAETGDWLGWSVASGDFNGDWYCDLAAGVPHESVTVAATGLSADDAGAVNVVYGSSAGLATASNALPENELWTRDSADVDGAATANAQLGWSLAAGDINHDGDADLAMGAIGDEVNGLTYAGSVSVIYGDGGGLFPTGSVKDQLWSQATTDVDGTAEAFDEFGYSLTIGNFRGGNGLALAVGVPGEDTGTGWLEVLYDWGSTGLAATGYADQWLAQGHSGILDNTETGDRFAESLS